MAYIIGGAQVPEREAAVPRKTLKQGSLKSTRKGGHVARKKGKVICPRCDARMKPRDVACRKCGARRPGGLADMGTADKALFVPHDGTAPFVVKMAGPSSGKTARAGAPAVTKDRRSGNVVPIGSAKSARRCWNGHP